ncbi:tetratricopeptide repeat protein [Arcobacter sp. LA11]|uniref:tetratricopeptide repeat protein n=1 Tax=Arcobacter sp. LA11 TaxID=1898176 RepID=UPI0009352057|nr:tetratricopeptide repeat protein [Arcobacter sp. LA11]
MKQKQIIKILLILTLTIFFTACNDNKKEMEHKAILSMPNVKESDINKYYKLSTYLKAKKDPISATKIGYAYSEELKDYDKAIEWYKYSNSMKPMGENSNYMCYAYQMKKEYEEAIKWCKNAIELGSDEALLLLGNAYTELNEYNESILWIKKAYEKNNPDAAINLGYSYSKINDYKNAEKWYKIAVKNNDYEAYKNLSTLYNEKLNDNIKASAYAIAVIDTKYSKSSVLRVLKEEMKIPNETIKKGYELQLNSDEFPIKYKGDLGL